MFDPFGDFESRGYLRNIAQEKDLEIVRRLEHVSFTIGLDDAFRQLSEVRQLTYKDVLDTHKTLFEAVYPKEISILDTERKFIRSLLLDFEELVAMGISRFTAWRFMGIIRGEAKAKDRKVAAIITAILVVALLIFAIVAPAAVAAGAKYPLYFMGGAAVIYFILHKMPLPGAPQLIKSRIELFLQIIGLVVSIVVYIFLH